MSPTRQQVVYYTSFATDYAYFAFLFAATRLLAETGGSQWQLGIFGACTSVSYALSGPLAGAVSDRWGRRRVMLTGAIGTIAVLAVGATWASRKLFYVMAAVGGVAVALIYPPLIAWLTEETRDLGGRLYRFCLAWNFGVIASQITGGWLFSIHPSLPMATAIVPMLGVVLLIAVWKPDPSPKAAAVPIAETAPTPETRKALAFVYLAWLSNFAGALSFSLIVHLFPFLAHELGISPPVHGAMLAINRLLVVGVYAVMYRFPFWHYRLWTALTSQAFAAAGLFILGYASSVPVLTFGLTLVAGMLGYNYFASIFYSTSAFGRERKGIASGIHEATLAFGGGVGALGGGILGTVYGSRTPYRLCVLLLLASIVIQITIYLASRSRWQPQRAPQEDLVV
ncbi:MAG: MFS transporter [Bryobacteraceae bacterium]